MNETKWMLSSSGQKILKCTHSLFSKVFGISLIILFVLMILRLGDGAMNRPGGDMSLSYVLHYGVGIGLLGAVATGLVYALCTRWGFFRYPWIIIKWLGVSIILGLIIAGLGPVISEMTAMSDVGLHLDRFAHEYRVAAQQGVIYCIVEIVLMTAMVTLSVFKPGKRRERKKEYHRIVAVIVTTLVAVLGVGHHVQNFLKLREYRTVKIETADLENLENGVYTGRLKVGSYTYTARVTVVGHDIVTVDFPDNRDSRRARFAEGVGIRIEEEDRVNVDAITGATITSTALKKAVAEALKNEPETLP